MPRRSSPKLSLTIWICVKDKTVRRLRYDSPRITVSVYSDSDRYTVSDTEIESHTESHRVSLESHIISVSVLQEILELHGIREEPRTKFSQNPGGLHLTNPNFFDILFYYE